MTIRRVRARKGDGALLREEILQAAESLLAETGAEEALTVRAVAERAGVSTPSVYLHFADKDALVEAVCLRVWDELGRLIADNLGGDPFHALGRCGRAYIRFAVDHPVQYRVLMMRPATPEAAHSCLRHMVTAVSACVDAGVLAGDPQDLALAMWTAAHGCASLLIAQPSFPWPADLDQQVIRMAGFGTALLSRLPAEVPPSADVVTALDELGVRLARQASP